VVVDVHAHVIVPGFGAEVRRDEQGQVVELDGRQIRSALREFVDLPRIVRALGLPPEDEAAILGGNAERLLRGKVAV
jgi:hypothetical protein